MPSIIKRAAVPGILFLIGLGFQISGFQNIWVGYAMWIVAAIWTIFILPPIKKKIPFLTRNDLTQEDILGISVQRCNLLDFFPQPDNFLSRILGHISILEVEAKFCPQGNIRLHSLELHMGRHTFNAKSLPAIILDREETYLIGFEVPSRLINLKKPDTMYLRAVYNDVDCRSNNFGFAIGTSQ